MCWKKIFGHSNPVIPATDNKVALLFAIDDYPGTQNDLSDCVMDQNYVAKFLTKNYPEFTIKKFINSAVTRSAFENAIKAQLIVMVSGDILLIHYSGHGTNGIDPSGTEADGYSEALYLHDGSYWDREFSKVLEIIPSGAKVIIALDSCFARGSTHKNISRRKSRFIETQKLKPGMKRKRSALKNEMFNYVVLAACQEGQTSSSTGNGGVFTIHWVEAWNRDFTYKQWSDKTTELTKEDREDQIPNIEGDSNLQVQIIFT